MEPPATNLSKKVRGLQEKWQAEEVVEKARAQPLLPQPAQLVKGVL
jgi:hypothetical protein